MSNDRLDRIAQIDEFIETRLPHAPDGDDFEVRERSGILIVDFTGSAVVDYHRIDECRRRLLELLKGRSEVKLVVDLSRVDFVDSAKLGLLVALWREVQRKAGELALVGSPLLRNTLGIAGLDRVWKVYGTEQEAVAALLG